MTAHPRRISHTHDAACPCEPVQAVVCECCEQGARSDPDPGCFKCHGLGAFRLPVGIAPREGALIYHLCRDGHEGKYPLWESYP